MCHVEIKSVSQGYKFKSLTGARREMLMKEAAQRKTIGSGGDCGELENTIPICKGASVTQLQSIVAMQKGRACVDRTSNISTKKSLYNGHYI